MIERIDRGLWPHPPIEFSYVVNHLVRVLKVEKYFPREWKESVEGEPVWEGGVIECQSHSTYVYLAQRHHPIHPNIIGDRIEKIFTSPETAARFYLKRDLNLPGYLDGWTITE